jgi:SAM-dependent methyltransferase
MEYDWEHRVNTTSGTVGWQARLLGLFHSPYQPTDPALFHEMMANLPIAFDQFTFVDLGSGKGRTLLMASEYPFRKIVGVELLAELHRAAEENIRAYHSATQQCKQIEAVLADAREFELQEEPLALYLFNPLPSTSSPAPSTTTTTICAACNRTSPKSIAAMVRSAWNRAPVAEKAAQDALGIPFSKREAVCQRRPGCVVLPAGRTATQKDDAAEAG